MALIQNRANWRDLLTTHPIKYPPCFSFRRSVSVLLIPADSLLALVIYLAALLLSSTLFQSGGSMLSK